MKKRIVFYSILLIGIIFSKVSCVKDSKKGEWKVAEKDQVLIETLKKHVYTLSHEIGDRNAAMYHNLLKSRQYIEQVFTETGYSVTLQTYEIQGEKYDNIIAEKPGKTDEVIVIGAHYDSCFNPGADDNASGVAGVLELAKYFSKDDYKKTLRFVAFVNEEPPFFKTKDMGSLRYAEEAAKEKEKIHLTVILEMIGYFTDQPQSQDYPPFLGLIYPSTGNFITFVGNIKSRTLLNQMHKAFTQSISLPVQRFIGPAWVPGVDFSDHWGFWENGFNAVMITDTAFYRNRNYHKQTDTYDTLDYEKMALVINGLVPAIVEIANQ